MNQEWLKDNVVYLSLHGSQAYGLANEFSDVDVKGICVPPLAVENNLFQKFEQAENNKLIEEQYGYLRNPKNPKFESVVYTLRKFFFLASKVNPNIIELLYTAPEHHFVSHPVMKQMFDNRDLFLSTKAKFTFTGYAYAQVAKIERHRKWIVKGELQPPKREDFGLKPEVSKGIDAIFGYVKKKVEEWNLNQFGFAEDERAEVKETVWDLLYELSQKTVNWDNWPDAYAAGALHKMAEELDLREEVVRLIEAEKAFHKAQDNYRSWLKWKAERNVARRELEVRSGYDTKHASHLVRLMRMGKEIMTTGKVLVMRPDAEEIVAIKNGAWSYEKVMEFAQAAQAELDGIYKEMEAHRKEGRAVPLPKEVSYDALNELYNKVLRDYRS